VAVITGEPFNGNFPQNKYPQDTIVCSANGYVLWNADVSAYQSQVIMAPVFWWIILLGIGFFTGLLFKFIVTGGATTRTTVEVVEEQKTP